MTAEEISKVKVEGGVFKDLSYSSGELLRIEPINGKNAIVLKYKNIEVYYDMNSGLKVKEVKTEKTPDGKEEKILTEYSNYKELNGVLFPYSLVIPSVLGDLNFEVKNIKVNEGVSDSDFK
ncbi:hypothetical protein N9E80_00660 [Flavobacteriaceae bacterium]|nr:hypothetical protein [Flavobacteriaceae bacterium]